MEMFSVNKGEGIWKVMNQECASIQENKIQGQINVTFKKNTCDWKLNPFVPVVTQRGMILVVILKIFDEDL